MNLNDKKELMVAELIGKMQQGNAVFMLWYYEPEDVFHMERVKRSVRGTLVNFRKDFGVEYRHRPGNRFVVYWDLELEMWRTFRIVNLVTEEE